MATVTWAAVYGSTRLEVHMGWWRIEPETGMPAKDAYSKLSHPPDFVLLNAVRGVDDDPEAHYLGDSPWDLAADTARQLQALLDPSRRISEEEARRLLLDRVVPQGIEEPIATELLQSVEVMRRDVDE